VFAARSVIIPSNHKAVELTAGLDTTGKYTMLVRLRPTTTSGNGVFVGGPDVGMNHGFLLSNDSSVDSTITPNPQVTATLQPGETVWAAQFTGSQQIVDVLVYSAD
jgi:hypothetical protein